MIASSIERRRRPAWGYIAMTFLTALVLNFLPLSERWLMWWPDWVLLVVFYWALMLPRHWGVYASSFTGLLEDIASYSLLGYHAVGAAFAAMLAGAGNRRLNLFGRIEQLVIVFCVVCLVSISRLWIDRLLGGAVQLDFWRSALSTALLWPVVAWALTRMDPKVRRYGQP